MAIVSATELSGKRSASYTRDGIKRQRVFLVKSNSLTDDTPTIEAAPGITLYAAHPSDSSVYCTSIDTQELDQFVWQVTFSYESLTACEVNPLTCSAEYEWRTVKNEEVFEKDADGDEVLNSANDPFEPAPTRFKSNVVLTVKVNAATFSGSTALGYCNKTNSDTFQGADPGTLLLSIESAVTQEHDATGSYWAITYQMEYDPDGWDLEILDAGMRQLDDQGEKTNILIKGREVTTPQLLDGAGEVLAKGANPEYLDFKRYERIAFSGLV